MNKCEKWTVAFRQRIDNVTILEDTSSPFKKISNTWRYWCADPFLFEHDGKTYLFAEMFDRLKLKGVIGYCQITGNKVTPWRIAIEEPFHLSYPFIFQYDGNIYMIPESFRAGDIILYKAIDFPYKWEKVKILANISAVDSTIFDTGKEWCLITVCVENTIGTLVIYKMNNYMELTEMKRISSAGDPSVRPAGRIIYNHTNTIRPAQECTSGYGSALNFYIIKNPDPQFYQEELFRTITPSDVHLICKESPKGIHTYNYSSEYEVIDYKTYEFGLLSKFSSLRKHLKNMIGK